MAKNKKQKILSTATKLFALQGFDNTTTLQIAKESGVTEPLLYYHFKGKEEIFTDIIRRIFDEYARLISSLPQETETEFDKISNLIRLHLHIAENRPHDGRLILANCPAKLKNDRHICQEVLYKQQELVTNYLRDCLNQGNSSGEFNAQPVDDLVIVILCLLNGIIRKKLLGKKETSSYEYTAIDFCRKALTAAD
ncbi:TetR/AcrR family transcriptional regulator [Desulfonatronovibrio hydrogenovorans]|uniref:TetR/AcrR family transcriptional regulator n=1 Tax=Desulfonatronovibrio hydrogenovorans TaxID=53245 RepID=UPI00048E73AC|nr:TetR/AcrR family transcriptional regulator [Desulfonatronovibrio hydrogenovorans]